MRKKTKILTLVLTLVLSLALFTISVSADYIRVPENSELYGLKYVVGSTTNLFTVNGKANTETFSDTISEGGQTEGVYTLTDITPETYPYYTASRYSENSTLYHQVDTAKYGYARARYNIQALDTLEAIQHDVSISIEGRYVDLFDKVSYELFIPRYTYHIIADTFEYVTTETTVFATLTYVSEHNQRIEGSGNSSKKLSAQTVATSDTINEAIERARASADSQLERLGTAFDGHNEPSPSHRARLTVSIKTRCYIFGNPQGQGFHVNDSLSVRAQYPICNSRSAFPNNDTIPFVTVTNKIDSDFSLTEWFGASARGIWKFEIVPNVSIGGIVTAILGISVTLAFLKFFAGG